MIKIKEESILSEKSKFKRIISQLKRSWVIGKKNLRVYYNKGPVIIQALLFPIILFFAFTIGRETQSIYIVSGFIAMVLFLSATSIGPVVFPWETRQKTLERLITCPISIKTILLGDVWASFIFGSVISIVPLILCISIFSFWNSINFVIIILGIIFASFSFSCFSTILSIPPSDTPASVITLTIFIKFPIIFMSPLFMPVESAPFGIISPLTYFIDIMNFGLSENSAFGPFGILFDFGILFIFGFLFLFLAFVLHKKILEKRFSG